MAPARLSSDMEPVGIGLTAIDLTGIVRAGAVYDGHTVRRVVIEWDTGELRAALPSSSQSEDDETTARILDALRTSAGPLTRKALATALGLKTPKGRFGQVVSALADTGRLIEKDGYLSDDATKFPDGD